MSLATWKTRFAGALLLAPALLATPDAARADLVLQGRSSVSALGAFTAGQEALMIRDKQLRRDVLDRGRAYSYLYDFAARRIVVVDHALRIAEVMLLDDLKSGAVKGSARGGFKMDLEKTDKQYAVRHWQCVEHNLAVSLPAELSGEQVTFQLNGRVWLAKNTPEQKEMQAFRSAASSPEFLVGLPAVAKITDDQAQAVGEAIRRISAMGTLCAFDVQSRYEGTGRMALLSQKMPTRLSLTYDNFKTEAIDERAFGVPIGYQIIRKSVPAAAPTAAAPGAAGEAKHEAKAEAPAAETSAAHDEDDEAKAAKPAAKKPATKPTAKPRN
jgi:hypothetical protein